MNKYSSRYFDILDYESRIGHKVISQCNKGYEKNKSFFGITVPKYKIIICHSEKLFKKYSKYRYSAWAKGVRLRDNTIVIRSQREISRAYKLHGGGKSFDSAITHEINHVFASNTWLKRGPYWLFEGIAMYLSNPNRKKQISFSIANKKVLMYKYNKRKVDENLTIFYPLAFMLTAFLIDKFKVSKLKSLIRTFNKNTTKSEYERNFTRIFGLSEKSIIKLFYLTLKNKK